MKSIRILTLLFIIFFLEVINAQDDLQIGSRGIEMNQRGALFDYSDPTAINIKVQLWGYVQVPGYYIVPSGTSLNELISLAGGPTQDALLDDIRVAKINQGSQTKIVKYNYDLMWEDGIKSHIQHVVLDAGDIVVVPGEPRYFVRQDIAYYLGIVTALASIAALIISITND